MSLGTVVLLILGALVAVGGAFRCAVAQMTPLKGGRDMPAEEVMRQQLLDHMWRHHGGITVIAVPKVQ